MSVKDGMEQTVPGGTGAGGGNGENREKPGKAGDRGRDKAGDRGRDKAGGRGRDKAGDRGRDKAGDRGRDKTGDKGRDKAGDRRRDKAGDKGRDKAGKEPRAETLCRVNDLTICFESGGRWCPAVKDLTFEIRKGEMAALIGESGCGKSVTALSMIGLQPEGARITGEILFEGRDIRELSDREWSKLRGNRISMVFQEPMTALNPLVHVGKQIEENLVEHRRTGRKEAREKVYAIMKEVGLPDVEALYRAYPHQLSGGQRQRIMLAMAFINNPQLLIADEPTTALDVTIQAHIMMLVKRLNRTLGTAVLLITHNLGLVKSLCSYVYIMYAGSIMEEGKVRDILEDPMHPYTKGLVAAIPDSSKRGRDLDPIPGTVPAIDARPREGCVFCGRCPKEQEICGRVTPPVVRVDGRKITCHFAPGGEYGAEGSGGGQPPAAGAL